MQVVNGFQCKNCTDIDYAKKHIDPAHPKDGPYGVNKAVNDPTNSRPGDPPVQFGGALKGLTFPPSTSPQAQPYTPGSQVDVAA